MTRLGHVPQVGIPAEMASHAIYWPTALSAVMVHLLGQPGHGCNRRGRRYGMAGIAVQGSGDGCWNMVAHLRLRAQCPLGGIGAIMATVATQPGHHQVIHGRPRKGYDGCAVIHLVASVAGNRPGRNMADRQSHRASTVVAGLANAGVRRGMRGIAGAQESCVVGGIGLGVARAAILGRCNMPARFAHCRDTVVAARTGRNRYRRENCGVIENCAQERGVVQRV